MHDWRIPAQGTELHIMHTAVRHGLSMDSRDVAMFMGNIYMWTAEEFPAS